METGGGTSQDSLYVEMGVESHTTTGMPVVVSYDPRTYPMYGVLDGHGHVPEAGSYSVPLHVGYPVVNKRDATLPTWCTTPHVGDETLPTLHTHAPVSVLHVPAPLHNVVLLLLGHMSGIAQPGSGAAYCPLHNATYSCVSKLNCAMSSRLHFRDSIEYMFIRFVQDDEHVPIQPINFDRVPITLGLLHHEPLYGIRVPIGNSHQPVG